MFTGEINNVINTKIFISEVYQSKIEVKKKDNTYKAYKIPVGKPLQMVIYSNTVQTQPITYDIDVPGVKIPKSVMVLPFPLIKGKNRVKILDLNNYNDFFDDLDIIFPTKKTKGFRGLLKSHYLTEEDDTILVQNVGIYKASIVPSLKELNKLNFNEFGLNANIKEILKRYYDKEFGFIICVINNTDPKLIQYQPFAYVHEIRSDGRLFVPTRRFIKQKQPNPYFKNEIPITVHDSGEEELNNFLYQTLMVDDKWMQINAKRKDLKVTKEKENVDWDHEIYVVNYSRVMLNPLLKKQGVKIINGDLNKLVNFYTYMDVNRLPKEIVLKRPNNLYKIKIDGNYKYNSDIYI